jgi:hypothetical protein
MTGPGIPYKAYALSEVREGVGMRNYGLAETIITVIHTSFTHTKNTQKTHFMSHSSDKLLL